MSWSKPRILLLKTLQISSFFMAQNSGDVRKSTASLNLSKQERKEKERGMGGRVGKKSRSLSPMLLIQAMTHGCILSFSMWVSICSQGPEAVRQGLPKSMCKPEN